MNSKIGSIVTLLAIVSFGIFYFWEINKVSSTSNSISSDFKFFPKILFFLLIFLCLISLFQAIKKEGTKIEVNFKLLAITVFLLVGYILSWIFTGYFYLLTFVFLFILFTIYGERGKNIKRSIVVNVATSVITTLLVYSLLSFLSVQV